VGKLEDPVMALLRELVRKKKLGKFLLSQHRMRAG
jgi:hypothetical protein